jgi:predicted MFS family arabinose efflux permease
VTTGAAATGWRLGVVAFAVFAAAYFLAALLRAVTATLAPDFSAEFALGAADLGLLAGAYFLGFSLLQLPLGAALDHWGPRRVELVLLLLAIAGCALFAAAATFVQLVLARTLIGMGVAACLMAPLTFFRRHLSAATQLRCNSWMLMTGSLGMVASTVPVQLLLPVWGWRGLFWTLTGLLGCAALGLYLGLPRDRPPEAADRAPVLGARYGAIMRHPQFLRVAPLGLVLYGGMIAMQALWAGPWLTRVCGWSPQAAAQGLLLINGGMLLAFLGWGWVMPVLTRRGFRVSRMLAFGVPVSLLLLAMNVILGARATAVHWMVWCMATSLVALSQPALAQSFPVQMAGRALSAYNLAVFAGVFMLQWGIGASIDVLQAAGMTAPDAFRLTFAGLLVLCLGSYLWFLAPHLSRDHNAASETLP